MPITTTRIRTGLLGLPVIAALALAGCSGASTTKPTATTPPATAIKSVRTHHHARRRRVHTRHPNRPAVVSTPAPAPRSSAPANPATGQSTTAPPMPSAAAKPPARTPQTKPAPTPSPASGGIPQHNGGDRDSDNNGGPSDGDGNL